MSYSDNKEAWFRSLIMDHYQTPRNKGLLEDGSYKLVHLKNPSCGDDLIVQVKFDADTVADIRHEGSGCAICCASASMMSENLKGKTIPTVKATIEAFYDMVSGKPDINETLLEEAVSLQGVAKLPPRIKCASLAYKALQQAVFDEDVEDEDVEKVL